MVVIKLSNSKSDLQGHSRAGTDELSCAEAAESQKYWGNRTWYRREWSPPTTWFRDSTPENLKIFSQNPAFCLFFGKKMCTQRRTETSAPHRRNSHVINCHVIGKGGESSTNESWRQKTRVLVGVVCVILRLAVLIQCV